MRVPLLRLAVWWLCVVPGLGAHAEPLHSFELIGGHFFGPGPIVPDTALPNGRLRNIEFDLARFRGHCQFRNSGGAGALLSDGRTRINQNIDAGRLFIGGGTSPILLAAVDGGPHHGTEQYYLDAQYRFVWRVDIALDPGFEEGIIRLDDFVLTTGVARVRRSLQSEASQPGGYDQAGSLAAGDYLAGRVGDFDEDGMLDGVLVAAPNVPMEADMLPGAPVGNRRGFRTDIPIQASLSAELMLHGARQLDEPLETTRRQGAAAAHARLLGDLEERLRVAAARLNYAISHAQFPARDIAVADALAGSLSTLSDVFSKAREGASADVRRSPSLTDGFTQLAAFTEALRELNERNQLRLAVAEESGTAGDATAALEPFRTDY
jgi:hypothetical protein